MVVVPNRSFLFPNYLDLFGIHLRDYISREYSAACLCCKNSWGLSSVPGALTHLTHQHVPMTWHRLPYKNIFKQDQIIFAPGRHKETGAFLGVFLNQGK